MINELFEKEDKKMKRNNIRTRKTLMMKRKMRTSKVLSTKKQKWRKKRYSITDDESILL